MPINNKTTELSQKHGGTGFVSAAPKLFSGVSRPSICNPQQRRACENQASFSVVLIAPSLHMLEHRRTFRRRTITVFIWKCPILWHRFSLKGVTGEMYAKSRSRIGTYGNLSFTQAHYKKWRLSSLFTHTLHFQLCGQSNL